jgi:hypothetical protein
MPKSDFLIGRAITTERMGRAAVLVVESLRRTAKDPENLEDKTDLKFAEDVADFVEVVGPGHPAELLFEELGRRLGKL